MKYEEAKDLALEHEVKICRKVWKDNEYYVECVRLGGAWETFLAMTEVSIPNKYPYTPDKDDEEADDWTLYSKPSTQSIKRQHNEL